MENENKISAILLKMREFEKRALQAKSNRTGVPMSVLLRREGLSGLQIEEYDVKILDVASKTEFLKVCKFNQDEYEDHVKSIGEVIVTDAGEERIIKSITPISKETPGHKFNGGNDMINRILNKTAELDKFQERKKLLDNAKKI